MHYPHPGPGTLYADLHGGEGGVVVGVGVTQFRYHAMDTLSQRALEKGI